MRARDTGGGTCAAALAPAPGARKRTRAGRATTVSRETASQSPTQQRWPSAQAWDFGGGKVWPQHFFSSEQHVAWPAGNAPETRATQRATSAARRQSRDAAIASVATRSLWPLLLREAMVQSC